MAGRRPLKKRKAATLGLAFALAGALLGGCTASTAPSSTPASAPDSGASASSAVSDTPSDAPSSDTTAAPTDGQPASASASSAGAASGSASPAAPLIASPDLLASSTSATSSQNTALPGSSFDFIGPYLGALDANGLTLEESGQTVESSVPDQIASMAQNGGRLRFAEGKLIKMGDSPDPDSCASYGTNSLALAVNPESVVILADTIAESAAVGSHGIFATDQATALANNVTFTSNSSDSGALRATYGGNAIASGLSTQSIGDRSPALAAAANSVVSVANSTLQTSGTASPVAIATGRIETDNIVGTTGSSPLATVEDTGSVLINGSKLSSTSNEGDPSLPVACAVALYRPSDTSASSDPQAALFQATDSSLNSSIKSGALFYLTNTQAKVVLADTHLNYDSDKAKLLMVSGNTMDGWGTAGRNGATVTFTARNQELKGDIQVDSISSADLWLLEGSRLEGSSEVLSSTAGAVTADNLSISIDGSSTWVVTGNSTVSNINLAQGGKLVDKQGRSVKLVDQNGFKLVDGSSDITITVNGGFTTTVKTTEANQPEGPMANRSAFDETFGTATLYGTNGSSALTPEEQRVKALIAAVKAWFAGL